MKLVRYGDFGSEKPGVIDTDGRIRDLSNVIPDIDGVFLGRGGLDELKNLNLDTLPEVSGSPRFGIPINGIPKLICIGLNYSDHAKESNMPIPTEPVVFMKAISALNGPNDDVILPNKSVKGDWEVELAVVISKTARNVEESDALSYVAGYTICNDVSEREWQLEHGGGQLIRVRFRTFQSREHLPNNLFDC